MRLKPAAVIACVLFGSVAAALALPSDAFATPSPMGDVLCLVISIILGNFGRALATLGVIFIGISALLGKVSWALALVVVVGITVMFSAPSIIVLMGLPPACP